MRRDGAWIMDRFASHCGNVLRGSYVVRAAGFALHLWGMKGS